MILSGGLALWELVWTAEGPAPHACGDAYGLCGVGKAWLVSGKLEELTDWLFPAPGLRALCLCPGMQGLWACWLRWIKVRAHSLQRRKGRRYKNKSWEEDVRFRYILWNWNSGLPNFSLGSLGLYHFTKCSSYFVKFRISFLSSSFPPFIHEI